MGKLTSLQDLKVVIKPNPREVWKLDDKKVRMERKPEEAVDGKSRYVLILSSRDLTDNKEIQSYNVVPFSNCDESNELAYPINRDYEYTTNGFKPSKDSHAIIHYYQPIRREFFDNICGAINEQTYIGIREAISMKVLGYCDFFDLEAD